jgi:hypothetical protein
MKLHTSQVSKLHEKMGHSYTFHEYHFVFLPRNSYIFITHISKHEADFFFQELENFMHHEKTIVTWYQVTLINFGYSFKATPFLLLI